MASIVRHLTEVNASFPAMSRAGKSCRIFLAQIMTNRAQQENPSCAFKVKVDDDVNQAAQLRVKFRDGHQMELATAQMKPGDILEVVGKYARKLQDKADAMNG